MEYLNVKKFHIQVVNIKIRKKEIKEYIIFIFNMFITTKSINTIKQYLREHHSLNLRNPYFSSVYKTSNLLMIVELVITNGFSINSSKYL